MESGAFEPKDWLRCNSCFSLMSNRKVSFSLSICSHIFCSKCVNRVTKKCPQCHTENIRMMSLAEPINPEVKHCFESNVKLSEKTKQATLFQIPQLSINSQLLNEYELKYTNVKVGYIRKSKDHKILQKEMQSLKSHLESLERKFCELKNSVSSSMMTPDSKTLSEKGYDINSRGYTNNDMYARQKSFNQPRLYSKRPEDLSRNPEFRIPSMTKVPRSVGSSSKSSKSYNRTPFSNFSDSSYRR